MMSCRIYELPLRWTGLHEVRCLVISTMRYAGISISTSTWTWTQTRAVWNTGLIKVHRYFEYICNWWRADFVCKSSQWLWMTMDTYLQRAILWGFLGDSWMHGNRSKRGYGSIHSWCLRWCATFLHVTGVADPTWCYWCFLWAELWKWCRMMWEHLELMDFWDRSGFGARWLISWSL